MTSRRLNNYRYGLQSSLLRPAQHDSLGLIAPVKWKGYEVYGDLTMILGNYRCRV